MPGPEQPAGATDVRLALPALAAWLSAAVAIGRPHAALASAGVLAAGGGLLLIGTRTSRAVTAAAMLCCAAAAAASAALHASAATPQVLTQAAAGGATARVELMLTGDPMPVAARTSGALGRPMVRFTARLTQLDVAGRATKLRAPVFVLASASSWSDLLPGSRVTVTARLAAVKSGEALGAVVLPRAPPTVIAGPGRLQRLAGGVRAGLWRGVKPLPAGPAALLPGLVIGDTSRLSPDVVEDFRTTGLTHLVAVSGANLAIVMATVLVFARRLRAGRRFSGILAGLAMLCFVVIARPSPSVLRAAMMGGVILIGRLDGRRSAALPALAAATLVLVLLDPSLARAPGFALSVLATAGIVLLAVPLQRRMPAWMPGWLSEALAVPLAAQLACTPVLVALFGRLSVIAVPANVLAAPAVPPATIVGVLVGVSAPVVLPLAQLLARLAQLPVAWLLLIASRGATVPGAAISWPAGITGATLGVVATAGAVVVIRRRMLRVIAAAAVAGALAAVGGVTRIAPAWPPPGWAMVACDVGQGDGLVLAAGNGAAVVVDAGPDPTVIDRCLRMLRVRTVPLVVLTHLHADHVEGLPGVLARRRVGGIEIGPLDEPSAESVRVRRWAAAARVPVTRVVDGEARRTGALSWRVIAPRHAFAGTDSDPNNTSIVLRVQLTGFTALLTGDIELEAQRELLASRLDVSADVFKVPHHGSGRQVPELLRRVGARLAVASVGAGNDYGHPAPITMARLAAAGAHAFRTDQDGAVAFLRRGAAVVGVGRRGSGKPAGRAPLASRRPAAVPGVAMTPARATDNAVAGVLSTAPEARDAGATDSVECRLRPPPRAPADSVTAIGAGWSRPSPQPRCRSPN
ncbi:MAG: ComEC/Rec2 family competence protein [Frankiaceae bacterium]